MAQRKVSAKKKAAAPVFELPFTRTNYMILAAGVLMITIGFFLMGIVTDPDDPLGLTVAPVLMVLAFIGVIPYGIMYRDKSNGDNNA